MTKQDYALVAQTLAYCERHAADSEIATVRWITGHLAATFAEADSSFDRDGFLRASRGVV